MPHGPSARALGGGCCAAVRDGSGEPVEASVQAMTCPACGTLWLAGQQRRRPALLTSLLTWGTHVAAVWVPEWPATLDA